MQLNKGWVDMTKYFRIKKAFAYLETEYGFQKQMIRSV